MQVQTLTIGVPDKAQQPQFTYTLSSATITPSAVPSESVIAGEMSVTAEGLLNCIDAGITEPSIEETAGNSDKCTASGNFENHHQWRKICGQNEKGLV